MTAKAPKFRLVIDTASAAFDDEDRPQEVARILRELAERMETRACLPDTVNLYDVNGNRVGKLTTK